jgi:PAS domain S-box-containing protein
MVIERGVTMEDTSIMKECEFDQSNGIYRMLFETSADAIVLIDALTGQIVNCNKEYELLTGFKFEDLIKMEIWDTHPANQRKKCTSIMRKTLKQGYGKVEFDDVRAKGAVIHSEGKGRAFTFNGKAYIQIVVRNSTEEVQRNQELELKVKERTSELRDTMRKLKVYNQKLRKLTSEYLRAQEKERKRIAIELHDRVTQDLINLCHLANELKEQSDESIRIPVENVLSRAKNALAETRNIMRTLYPSTLARYGLIEMMRQELGNLESKAGISTQLKDNQPIKLDPIIETTLYRIFHEALLNIENHSCSTKNIWVNIGYQSGFVKMDIKDNGVGFDIKSVQTKDPGGLEGMRQRAELVDGHFDLESNPGKGTKISVKIPIHTSDEIIR